MRFGITFFVCEDGSR